MKNLFIVLIFTRLLASFAPPKANPELVDLIGKPVPLNKLLNSSISVFIFLSPDCPLCQSYTLTINQLNQKYRTKDVSFIGVIPGKSVSVADIKNYQRNYKLNTPVYRDPELKLTQYLGATITPEAFVLNQKGEIRYSGRIDNWAYELGKKRTVITSHDLNNAISNVLKNPNTQIQKTKAVGCFIE